jgi:hypothetical protein
MSVDSLVTSQEPLAMAYRKLVNYQHLIVPVVKSRSSIDWLRTQSGSWNGEFQVPFADVLTTRGSGFSFNVMDADKIFRTDE